MSSISIIVDTYVIINVNCAQGEDCIPQHRGDTIPIYEPIHSHAMTITLPTGIWSLYGNYFSIEIREIINHLL